MKLNELRALSPKDLRAELASLLQAQFKTRMQRGSGQAIRAHVIRELRRGVARVKTVLREKEVIG